MRLILLVAVLFIALPAYADTDPRYCGIENIKRDSSNKIIRSRAEYWRFRGWWKCPSTQVFKATCADWAVDHIIPLDVGGCDKPENMQWLKLEIKSCAGADCKDRWERDVYAPDRRQP